MDGTYDVRKKRVKGDHKILVQQQYGVAIYWDLEDKRNTAQGGGGVRVKFNFRYVKLELLYDIIVRYWVGSWT